MHPNCRHEFLPFQESFVSSPEELEKVIERSNHFEELDKNDNLFKIYNKEQAFLRQLVDEKREFDNLTAELGSNMPYKTIGGFRRARREGSIKYKKIHYRKRDILQYERWKNILEEEDMPKTFDNFQDIKYNYIEQYQVFREKVDTAERAKAEKQKNDDFRQRLEGGALNTNIRKQKQDEHIAGTKQRSKRIAEDQQKGTTSSSEFFSTVSVEKIVHENMGKGYLEWARKREYPIEYVDVGQVIGQVWDSGENKYVDTDRIAIVYSGKGIHAYPVKKRWM